MSRTIPSGLICATCTPSSAPTGEPTPSRAPVPSACWPPPRPGARPDFLTDRDSRANARAVQFADPQSGAAWSQRPAGGGRGVFSPALTWVAVAATWDYVAAAPAHGVLAGTRDTGQVSGAGAACPGRTRHRTRPRGGSLRCGQRSPKGFDPARASADRLAFGGMAQVGGVQQRW
jgi:hypothetical protein